MAVPLEKIMGIGMLLFVLTLHFLLHDAMGTVVSKAAYSPASPDDLITPMDVLDIDAPTCGQDCYGNDRCMSFAYDAATGKCMKYDGNYFGNFQKMSGKQQRMDIPVYTQPMYFFNLSHALDLGYRLDRDTGLCYKIAVERRSHDDAETACSLDKARLLAVQTNTQLNALLAYAQSSTDVAPNLPLHVAGSGVEMTYFDAQPIADTLFSANGLSAPGNCTQLTTAGLSNGGCLDSLFYVCAY